MSYATPKTELILFSPVDMMITSEKGELGGVDKPWSAQELVIRDIEDI